MGEGKFLKLSDISAYKKSFHLSNNVWDIVKDWDYFLKDTVEKQWVRAIDSMSANIAEGFGRYGKKDKIKFYYYCFGSMKESQDWTQKAFVRKLISEEQYNQIMKELNDMPKEVHSLIKFTDDKLKK